MHAVAGVAGVADGTIDAFDYVDGIPALVPHPRPAVVPRGAPIIVSGWAVDPATRRQDGDVALVVDRARSYACETRVAREDVALRAATDEHVGFRAVIPTDDLPPGMHEVRAYLNSPAGWCEVAGRSFRLFEPLRTGLGPVDKPSHVRIEQVRAVTRAGVVLPAGSIVQSGGMAMIVGWAVEPGTGRGVAGVAATDTTGRTWSAPCDVARADVAGFGGAFDHALGFELLIPTDVLGRGRHTVRVSPIDVDGRPYGAGAEAVVDVAGPPRRFPVYAMAADRAPRCSVSLRHVDASGDHPATKDVVLEGGVVSVQRGQAFVVEGWALDASGNGASEVFIEIGIPGSIVPPHRHASVAGFRRTDTSRPNASAPPVEDAFFTCPFGTLELELCDYSCSLVVVEPDRRTLARAQLATLRVGARRRPAD